MILKWVKCAEGKEWCPFETVNLENVTTSGVYVIWYIGETTKAVRVGQGNIAERILAHRRDPEITKFAALGKLVVTWATLAPSHRDGVERYLADRWSPLVGDAFPEVDPIPVNLPGE